MLNHLMNKIRFNCNFNLRPTTKHVFTGFSSIFALLYHVYKPQTVFTVFLVLLLILGYDAIVYRKVFNRFCTTFPVINGLQLLSENEFLRLLYSTTGCSTLLFNCIILLLLIFELLTQSKILKLQFLAKSIFAQLIFLRERNPGVFCLFNSCILVCMLLISCVFSSFTLLIFVCNVVVLSSDEQLDFAAQKFFDFLMKFEECLTPGCTSANRGVLESFVPEMDQQALAILSEVSDVQRGIMLDDTTDLLPQIIETPESSETEEFNLLPDKVKSGQSTSDESVEIHPVERVMIVDDAQDNVNRWLNRHRLSPELSEDTDDLNTSDIMTDSYELVSDEDFHSS